MLGLLAGAAATIATALPKWLTFSGKALGIALSAVGLLLLRSTGGIVNPDAPI